MRKPSFKNFDEYLQLLWVNTAAQTRTLIEFFRTSVKYYTNRQFCKVDLFLLITYLFDNPFAISKRFLMRRGEKEIHTYGETPFSTMELITKECQIASKDTLFELGCGRGRTCFWLKAFIGCKVVGIDYIPEFIERANAVKAKFKLEGVEFRHQDMINADLTGATVIYLYGTCLDDSVIEKLLEKFKTVPAGTKIITVSYPLTDYTQQPIFEVMKRFPARFTWGTGDVYLHIKK